MTKAHLISVSLNFYESLISLNQVCSSRHSHVMIENARRFLGMEQQTIGHAELLEQMPAPLMRWYHAHARVLPWREQPTPYPDV